MTGSAMVRVLTLSIPDWPAVAVAGGDESIVVIDRGRVIAASASARSSGVRVGDRRRAATRACPGALVIQRDPLAEVRAFDPVIAAIAATVSPRVEIDRPGELRFDMRGPTRRLGGEQGVIDAVMGALNDLPLPAVSIGVADGPTVSSVAAQQAIDGPLFVPVGGSPAFLAPLALSALHEAGVMSAETIDLLSRLGITAIGGLAALDPGDVLVRFGVEGARAHRIASGVDDRLLSAIEPTALPERERRFDDPLPTVSPAVFAIREMAEELTVTLSSSGLSCTALIISAETDHSEWNERYWYRAEGFSSASIVDRGRWQLDSWVAGGGTITAGIVLVRIRVVGVRADVGRQDGFWGGITAADEVAARAVARLAAICGEEQVRVPVSAGGRLPGERCVWVPAATTDLNDPVRATPPPVWPGSVTHPAPTVVPPSVEPVEVLDADGQSVVISGRGEVSAEPVTVVIGGARHPVVAWAGPWPLLEHWWDPRHRRRMARLQVVLGDGRAHLLAVEQRQWSLMGSYD